MYPRSDGFEVPGNRFWLLPVNEVMSNMKADPIASITFTTAQAMSLSLFPSLEIQYQSTGVSQGDLHLFQVEELLAFRQT